MTINAATWPDGQKSDSITVMTAAQAVSNLGHLKSVKEIHCFSTVHYWRKIQKP
jgi:hypothetical protein